ncbi:ATP-grasp domain-containing protein [Streptomyces sp. AB3(2024)]|uniref:ATP-grasp domain-containing protein n=1 Tax=Streptomyces sp. AB3(2024) TaxID=3317321 RepID=UPI0035A2F5EB
MRQQGTTTGPRHRPVAVLLGPRPAEVAAARRAGARTVVVAPDPSVPSDREGAERRVRTDWRDHPRLVGAVARLAEVGRGRARVFGFGPATALAAARANEALGLPGTPASAVTALMDKASLRARANTLHPARPVSFARCGRAALIPFLTTLIGYPCVIKPRAGTQGEGVLVVHDEAGARAAAPYYPEVTDLLVEEFLEGPELAVQTLSRQGRHRVLGWTRTLPAPTPDPGPPAHAPTAAGHDAPVALDPATAEAVRALVRGVLDLAGHRDGPSHTEVVLTARGPRLIETHPHPGAEEVTQLLRLAHGTDVLAHALTAGLGLPTPVRKPPATAHAGLRYVDFPPGSGPAGAADALAAARALPGVVRVQLQVPPDATVRRAPTGALRHAYVLATGPTRPALTRSLDRATTLLHTPAPAQH